MDEISTNIFSEVDSMKHHIPAVDATTLYPALENFPLLDQRYLPRWDTDRRAYYHVKGSPVIYRTRLKNLTASGVCLYVGKDVAVRQKLEMKIHLSPDKSFQAYGTVVWTYVSPRHLSWAGVAFDNLPQQTQDLILEYAFEIPHE